MARKQSGFHPVKHPGKLHRELGIPESEKIPQGRLKAAAHSSNPEVRRDAIRAETMEGWDHSRGHPHVRPRSHPESAYRRK